MDKKKVFSTIGYGLILIDLIVIFINQKNYKVLIFAVAFGALVYGIMSIFKKNVIGYIITCLSVSLAITGGLYFGKVLDLAKSFTFMISSSVAILMLLTLVFSVFKKKIIDKEYSLSIEAECVELINNPNTDSKFYQPLYRYYINDHQYTVPYPGFIDKNIPKIGEKRIIRVDENDNQNVYFEKTKMEKLVDYFLIIFFLVVSIIIMIGQFK